MRCEEFLEYPRLKVVDILQEKKYIASCRKIKLGVQHASVLGPDLMLLYANIFC